MNERMAGEWTIVADEQDYAKALEMARGSYQANILLGIESLSCSTLKGKASNYSGSYKRIQASLIGKLRAAGIAVGERTGPRGKRLLVIGAEK